MAWGGGGTSAARRVGNDCSQHVMRQAFSCHAEEREDQMGKKTYNVMLLASTRTQGGRMPFRVSSDTAAGCDGHAEGRESAREQATNAGTS